MRHLLRLASSRASDITDDVSESGLGAGVIYEHVKHNGFLKKTAISASFTFDIEELVFYLFLWNLLKGGFPFMTTLSTHLSQ